ncbi:uncharacterized protein BP5553_10287 [Venustampulla echinocandica]|uniref:Heterokaryon incompatibility domain-containing protein n=1 Tax=Venustampulla echinocandica TaxID=2656787 RepID=A0A370T9S2_9HELO|nr:uncharacterized protein BP5553_10287 [Venustampulla echinocandica]RDL30409.1 hypothetical protein BP5553_10287 [Venustampulla echinocandica]
MSDLTCSSGSDALATKMSPAADPNIFKLLDRSTPSIRLIQILLEDDRAISCKFHNFNLADCPPYQALSYAWGPSEPTANIELDGSPFTVRENLYQALRALRRSLEEVISTGHLGPLSKPFTSSYFWVDAICIDQANVLERNHQVNLMSRIYSQASTVAVWLGPETEDSALAMKHLSNKVRFHQNIRDAISALCHRPYWNRLWIIQELVLAKSIYVLCGSGYQDWENLVRLASNMEDEDEDHINSSRTNFLLPDSPARNVITFRSRWNTLEAKKKTLDSFIVTGGIDKAECTDPRDRVFGLLGLVDELGAKSLGITEADYEKSKEEIYCDVLRFLKHNPDGLSMSSFWIAKPLAVMLRLTTKEDPRSNGFKLLHAFFHPRAGEVADEEEELRLILEAFEEEES